MKKIRFWRWIKVKMLRSIFFSNISGSSFIYKWKGFFMTKLNFSKHQQPRQYLNIFWKPQVISGWQTWRSYSYHVKSCGSVKFSETYSVFWGFFSDVFMGDQKETLRRHVLKVILMPKISDTCYCWLQNNYPMKNLIILMLHSFDVS